MADLNKVKISVGKLGIKEWFKDQDLYFHDLLQDLATDPDQHPLEIIIEKDTVYQIVLEKKITPTKKGGRPFKYRVVLTDLENYYDFTMWAVATSLQGCRIDAWEQLPEKIYKVIGTAIEEDDWEQDQYVFEAYLRLKHHYSLETDL